MTFSQDNWFVNVEMKGYDDGLPVSGWYYMDGINFAYGGTVLFENYPVGLGLMTVGEHIPAWLPDVPGGTLVVGEPFTIVQPTGSEPSSVPDGGSSVALLGLACLGMAAVRRH